ncbi:hypothetical protein, partial [Gloeocapsopsis dulcis]|uniref:hypothetical protein n=1 Tax=Gloeocapsopsis dulcis TaxID=2859516 RepID=UPI0019D5792F
MKLTAALLNQGMTLVGVGILPTLQIQETGKMPIPHLGNTLTVFASYTGASCCSICARYCPKLAALLHLARCSS